ncbi:hypothetical protein OIO90_002173 [Microbotryomycetes sp. JL221]|nr:hypothetical protein OIO90_002173 [Microbotryomycetes sp. JL221]
MAWRCSSNTNSGLVHNLATSGLLTTPRVIEAFLKVDRANFISTNSSKRDAYTDSPLYLMDGATISAPHMHAHALENLAAFLKPGSDVLDVGCGSGYLLAVMHHLVSPSGSVLGIDHLDSLTSFSTTNLSKDQLTAQALESRQIQIITSDGRLGAPKDLLPAKGFDVIHVGAASPQIPSTLIEQLKSPGRMFVPIGTSTQAIWQIDKDEAGKIDMKQLFGVNYVPLTDAELQRNGN